MRAKAVQSLSAPSSTPRSLCSNRICRRQKVHLPRLRLLLARDGAAGKAARPTDAAIVRSRQ
eukprot:1275242-Pleurochrysis_carterae.AAC.1